MNKISRICQRETDYILKVRMFTRRTAPSLYVFGILNQIKDRNFISEEDPTNSNFYTPISNFYNFLYHDKI